MGFLKNKIFEPGCDSLSPPDPDFTVGSACYVESYYNLGEKLIAAAENICAQQRAQADTILNKTIIKLKINP